jgi:hypothetical protein
MWYKNANCMGSHSSIYRKMTTKEDMEMLQKDVDRLGVWAVENEIKINPSKSKAVRFTRTSVKEQLNYS